MGKHYEAALEKAIGTWKEIYEEKLAEFENSDEAILARAKDRKEEEDGFAWIDSSFVGTKQYGSPANGKRWV